jgi:LuxR family maltose regulon positive regulatory protein
MPYIRHRRLKRERISTQLNNMFNYPLTLVVAAMGYGKTIAVRGFLDEAKAKYAWLSVESDENSAQYLWDSLTRQLAKTAPELGDRLNALGFPLNAPQRDAIVSAVGDYVYMTNTTILVIDDYHFAHSPELDRLIEQIVKTNIDGLHILIISRTRPEMNIEELRLKGYCYLFNSELFEMSEDEIREYFKLYGYDVSADTARQVYEISEGWITAVYLIIQRYGEIGRLEPGRDIESLIEAAVMSRYSVKETRILKALSVLDSFTPEQAIFVTGVAAAAMIIQRLSSSNSFIRFDERTGTYRMHNIFSGYLRKRLEERFDGIEPEKLYRRSGQWHIKNGEVLQALKYFSKAKEYDLILAEFDKFGITKVTDKAPQFIVEMFAQIPTETKYRHPIGYITYADFYLSCVDMEGGAEILSQIEEHYENDSSISPALKRRISGEIELARSLVFFNDVQKMHELQFKAHRLLDGKSLIAHKDMLFTFGSPHTLYLYYRKKGELLWLVEYLEIVFHYYREVSNGCGTGFEALVRAEYHLETGDFAHAEFHAKKAIYKARTMDQISIIVCANLTLARLYAAQGRFTEAKQLLYDLSGEVSEYNNPVFNSAFDLCAGYLGGILGDPQSLAGWLKSGDMKKSDVLYQGMAFNYIIHAKAVLLERDYLKLEVLCDEMQRLFSTFNNLFGFVHTHILDAAAKYKLYGMEKAMRAILPALDIGRADNIILPFSEYGMHILDILEALQKETGNDEYLDRLVSEAARYDANLKRMNSQEPPAAMFTKRESEILRLVAEGKTNRKIATQLYLAEVTVRKNITAIYRKLGVEGRAAAVRKAMELKLT